MVSTRHHPSDFPSPAPTYSTPKTSNTTSNTSSSNNSSPSTRSTPDLLLRPHPSSSNSKRSRSRPSRPSSSRRPSSPIWQHHPSPLTLLWLALAIPLVLWDAGYVLLRPHTLPASASAAHPPGRWHAPLWRPYALYASVDRLYGWDGRREGFVGAQSVGNVLETVGYAGYVFLVWWWGRRRGDGGYGRRVLEGPAAAKAVLIGFAVSVLTVGKTGLYGLNEYFSGWSHVGHNSTRDLILLWIIPNGAWIVFPTYMAYHFAVEILRGLNIAAAGASGGNKKRR